MMDECFRCKSKTPAPLLKRCPMCGHLICKKCGCERYGVYACRKHFEGS